MKRHFTPGPWEVDIQDGIPGVFAEDAAPICYTREVRGFTEDWQRDTAEGDAYLIAGAPELLQQLQKAHRFLRKSGYDMTEIDALITKITGEA